MQGVWFDIGDTWTSLTVRELCLHSCTCTDAATLNSAACSTDTPLLELCTGRKRRACEARKTRGAGPGTPTHTMT